MTDLRSVPCIAYPQKYQKAIQMEVITVMLFTVCKVCKKSNCNHEKIVSTLSKIVENTGKVFPNGKVRVHKRMQIFVI